MEGISIELVDVMGNDSSVSNSARVSFNKWKDTFDDGDKKLIKYLADHKHMTPFRHTQVQLRCKAPIFLVRQLMKHQVGLSWNEVSRRYVDSRPEFYIPDVWRARPEASIKQGSEGQVIIDGVKVCKNCGSALSFIRREDEKMKEFCSSKCQGVYYKKSTSKGWASTKCARLKQSAIKRGLEFDLTTEDLMALGTPKNCPYLGIELDYNATEVKSNSPSVNRVDNTKGYLRGNIEIISNKANMMLSDATAEEITTFVKNISLKRNGIFMETAHSIEDFYEKCADTYDTLIKDGMAPELARGILPVAQLTEWVWSGNILAFAHVYKERISSGAQLEAQVFAKELDVIIREKFPVSWAALVD